MPSSFTLSAAPALLAVLSITATPAAAADLPVAAPSRVSADVAPAWSPGEDTAANYRRWRHRRNRVDVGDVLTGVLIVGGIAAIAKAATRHRDYRYRDRNGDWRYRGGGYPDTRYPDSRYPGDYPDNRDYRGGDYYGGEESRGFDRAVDQCVAEIERNERVQRVDSVERDGNGWRVSGSLHNGEGFSCSVSEDGRIENLGAGGGADPYRSGDAGSDYGASEDRQWDDGRYSEERARIEGEAGADMAEAPQYEYPESQDMGEPDYGEVDEGTGYQGADD